MSNTQGSNALKRGAARNRVCDNRDEKTPEIALRGFRFLRLPSPYGLKPIQRPPAATVTQVRKEKTAMRRAVGVAEFAMFAEVTRNNGICRMLETQQLAEHGFGVGKKGGGEAGFHGIPNSVMAFRFR